MTKQLINDFFKFQHRWLEEHADEYYLQYLDRQENHLEKIKVNKHLHKLGKDCIDMKNIKHQFLQQYGFHLAYQKSIGLFEYPSDPMMKRTTKYFDLKKLKIYTENNRNTEDIYVNDIYYRLFDTYRAMYASESLQLNIQKDIFPFYFPSMLQSHSDEFQICIKQKSKPYSDPMAVSSSIEITELDNVMSIRIPITLSESTEGDMVYFALYRQIPQVEVDIEEEKEEISTPKLHMNYFNYLPKENHILIQSYFKINHKTFNLQEFTTKYLNQRFEGSINNITSIHITLIDIEQVFDVLLLSFQIDQRNIYAFNTNTFITIEFDVDWYSVNHQSITFQNEYYTNIIKRLCNKLDTQYQEALGCNEEQMQKLTHSIHSGLTNLGLKTSLKILFKHFKNLFIKENFSEIQLKAKFELMMNAKYDIDVQRLFKDKNYRTIYDNEKLIKFSELAQNTLYQKYLEPIFIVFGFKYLHQHGEINPILIPLLKTSLLYTVLTHSEKEKEYDLDTIQKDIYRCILQTYNLNINVIKIPQTLIDFPNVDIPDPTVFF